MQRPRQSHAPISDHKKQKGRNRKPPENGEGTGDFHPLRVIFRGSTILKRILSVKFCSSTEKRSQSHGGGGGRRGTQATLTVMSSAGGGMSRPRG